MQSTTSYGETPSPWVARPMADRAQDAGSHQHHGFPQTVAAGLLRRSLVSRRSSVHRGRRSHMLARPRSGRGPAARNPSGPMIVTCAADAHNSHRVSRFTTEPSCASLIQHGILQRHSRQLRETEERLSNRSATVRPFGNQRRRTCLGHCLILLPRPAAGADSPDYRSV